jgi:phosphonate transport system substrate-binding protein
MKGLRFSLFPLLGVLLSIPLVGCKMSEASGAWPTVLHYAFQPSTEQLQSSITRTDEMRKYLESQLHISVDLVQLDQYAATIEAMRADKVDIAHFGAFSYIIAAQKADAQAIVSRGYPGGKLGGYRSLIAAPKDSPIHSLAELKADAKNIVFAFADPASTSGDLYPRVELKALGIQPERDFKRVLYANGHLADMLAIQSGKVGAGAFDEAYMTHMIALGKMKPGDVRVLWTSQLIPNEPIAVRGSLPEQLKKEIQIAFLNLPTKDPALFANLNRNVYSSTAGTTYIPVSDATYNGLRQYVIQIKQFDLVEK